MAEPFLGEIRIFSFNFPPRGWAFCNNQLLPINQNQALFSLLGTTYGGNGQTTFALPELRGRASLHMGAGFTQGQAAGQTAHTVTISEMPQHIHGVTAVAPNDSLNNVAIPTGNFFSNSSPAELYNVPGSPIINPLPPAVSNTGGSQPHNNEQPYLTLNFCIALQGIFPSQT